jgi:hypothetical protein
MVYHPLSTYRLYSSPPHSGAPLHTQYSERFVPVVEGRNSNGNAGKASNADHIEPAISASTGAAAVGVMGLLVTRLRAIFKRGYDTIFAAFPAGYALRMFASFVRLFMFVIRMILYGSSGKINLC